MLASEKSFFRSQFQAWDKDGSGSLDQAELGVIFETCGMSRKNLDRVFKCIDVDGDGLIAREEFLNWLDPINHATRTESSEASKRVRNGLLFGNHTPTQPSNLKPVLQNMRSRFPEVDEWDLKRALDKSNGHGGRAIQIIEEEKARAQLMKFQDGVGQRRASQTPPASHPGRVPVKRPSLPSLLVPEKAKDSNVVLSWLMVPEKVVSRGSSRKTSLASVASSSSGSRLESDEDEESAFHEGFAIGDVVVLQNYPPGLNLNRSRGIVRGWSEQAKRYEVQIPGSQGVIRVAAKNLRKSNKVKTAGKKDGQGEENRLKRTNSRACTT